jgi:hypothetical protein
MSKAAERFVDAILAGETAQMINEMARQVIEKKTRKAVKRRQEDWMVLEEFPDGSSDQSEEEMSLEEFVEDDSDLDREINQIVEVLNEKAGGFHYNALPKIHQTPIGAGFKQVQSNNRIHHYHNDVIRHPTYGMHVVASWAGYKLRLPTGKIATGRHYKHLRKHLGKYSDASSNDMAEHLI